MAEFCPSTGWSSPGGVCSLLLENCHAAMEPVIFSIFARSSTEETSEKLVLERGT